MTKSSSAASRATPPSWAAAATLCLFVLLHASTAWSTPSETSTTDICREFRGRLLGYHGSTPIPITCKEVERLAEHFSASIARSPFAVMVQLVREHANVTFDTFLAEPDGAVYRQRCHEDPSPPPAQQQSFTCLTFGVPFRFFLDDKRLINHLSIRIDQESRFSVTMLEEANRILAAMVDPPITRETKDAMLMVWNLGAIRLNQLAGPGETYRVENSTFVVTIANIWRRHA